MKLTTRALATALAFVALAFSTVVHADPIQGQLGGGGSGVPTSRTVSTTSPLGGGGALSGDLTLTCATCVVGPTSATDNAIVRFDATTGKLVQGTGVVIDDSNRLGFGTWAPTHTITLASAATGQADYNTVDQVTDYERALSSWVGNVYTIQTDKGGSGTTRNLTLASGAISSLTMGGSGNGSVAVVGSNGSSNLTLFSVANNSQWGSSTGVQSGIGLFGTLNQSSAAAWNGVLVNPTISGTGSGGAKFFRAQSGGADRWWIDTDGAQDVDSTITAAGTTGARTINKPAGTVNVAAAASSITVTNSLITANTILSVLARTNDSTCGVKNYVAGAGTVTINMTAACTAETSVGFCILDKN